LSLVEVMLVILTLFLLAAVFLPRMGSRSKPRSLRVSCTSNLKQVGLAYRLFSNDHGDQFPFAVSNELGGTLTFANSPQVFPHFEAISNEIVTPKVLACPADTARVRASDFLKSLANNNLSYFIGLGADESKPQRLLSGDRNITGGTLTNGFMRLLGSNSLAGWDRSMHNNAGNVGLADGSVQQVTPQSLQRQLQAQDLPVIRLAIP
jgi:prepilin-type processing-associated H-X9-DG protein